MSDGVIVNIINEQADYSFYPLATIIGAIIGSLLVGIPYLIWNRRNK